MPAQRRAGVQDKAVSQRGVPRANAQRGGAGRGLPISPIWLICRGRGYAWGAGRAIGNADPVRRQRRQPGQAGRWTTQRAPRRHAIKPSKADNSSKPQLASVGTLLAGAAGAPRTNWYTARPPATSVSSV